MVLLFDGKIKAAYSDAPAHLFPSSKIPFIHPKLKTSWYVKLDKHTPLRLQSAPVPAAYIWICRQWTPA